jgi:hypothetical protein
MEDIKKITIEVKGIEQVDGKVILLEQTGDQKYPTRYSFFQKKQDGTESKAYTQFKELKVETGKVYTLAVKENKGINPKSNKEVTYRNVMYFADKATYQAPTPQQPTNDLAKRLDKASEAFKEMQNKINELEVRVGVLEMEQAQKETKELNAIPY